MNKLMKLTGIPTISAIAVLGLAALGCSKQGENDSAANHNHDMHSMNHAKADAASPAESTQATVMEAKPYPISTCLVSGEEVESMGEPARLVHEGQEIKFCCEGCIDDFRADPASFLAKLTETPMEAGSNHSMKHVH